MMPSVEISPRTFARLQAHAIPLVDNIETIINRMVDFYESKEGSRSSLSDVDGHENVRQFNPVSPPDLTHTKVLSIEFCGRVFDRNQTNWAALLIAAIREAKASTKSLKELKPLLLVPFVEGQKTVEGYQFYPDLGISVQGQDARGAWKAIAHIARELGRPVTVTFVWREKEGASFPGVTGRFSIPGR